MTSGVGDFEGVGEDDVASLMTLASLMTMASVKMVASLMVLKKKVETDPRERERRNKFSSPRPI